MKFLSLILYMRVQIRQRKQKLTILSAELSISFQTLAKSQKGGPNPKLIKQLANGSGWQVLVRGDRLDCVGIKLSH